MDYCDYTAQIDNLTWSAEYSALDEVSFHLKLTLDESSGTPVDPHLIIVDGSSNNTVASVSITLDSNNEFDGDINITREDFVPPYQNFDYCTEYFIYLDEQDFEYNVSNNSLGVTPGNNDYVISPTTISQTTAAITLSSQSGLDTGGYVLGISNVRGQGDSSGTYYYASASASHGPTSITFNITLPSTLYGTYYATVWFDDGQDYYPVTGTIEMAVTIDTPRTATESQWGDLVSKINAKFDGGNGSVTTNMLQDGAVTFSKLADKAGNRAVLTANNLSPTADTPPAWQTLFGSTNGYYCTYYNVAGKFDSQPFQYGFLETIINGSNVYQRWVNHTHGPMMFRAGNTSGWYDATNGSWHVIMDNRSIGTLSPVLVASSTSSTFLASGDNLQNNTFCQPGNYCARNNTIAGSLLNAPTNKAFKMIVMNTLSSGTTVAPEVGQSIYLIRMAITYAGDIYVQYVANNNTASWSFSAWKHIFDSSNAITEIQANGTSVATSGVANIPAASTSAYGVTKLSSSTSSTSTALAATASAVKSAYDLANGKAKITCQTTDPGTGATLAANNFIAVYTA